MLLDVSGGFERAAASGDKIDPKSATYVAIDELQAIKIKTDSVRQFSLKSSPTPVCRTSSRYPKQLPVRERE